MSNVIDTLFLELGIDTSQFSEAAQDAINKLGEMEQSFDRSEQAAKNNEKQQKKSAEQQKKSNEQLDKLHKSIGAITKGFAAFTAVLMGASGLTKLATDAAKANQELDNLSKNLNTSSKEMAAWQGAAGMAGGSAAGMSGYMQQLSGDMNSLIMQGNTAMLPYFNALGVSMLDGTGKARQLDDVLLDLSDRFSSMDRSQAYTLAKQMGMDDGTFNTLVRGRAEIERTLALQEKLYRSSEQDIENSRKFNEVRSLLNQQWESLLLLIGNALLPVLTEVTAVVTHIFGYVMANEHAVEAVFYGISSALGLVLLPMLVSATAAVIAFIAPFTPLILIVGALGTAFTLLYDDYRVWSEGGKSLFDWGIFTHYIKTSEFSVKNLINAFAMLFTGYKSWSEAGNNFFNWLKMKGFIDETGVSVNSLTTGFRNLAHDLKEFVMPFLMDFVEVFNKIKEGDFQGAWEAVKRGAERRWELVKDIGSNLLNRATGAVDVATGHDPYSESSLSVMLGRKNLYTATDFGARLSKVYDDITYKMGGKNIQTGKIDCSGYIDALNKNVVNSLEKELGKEAAKKARIKASGGAAGIFQDQSRRGNLITRANSWQELNQGQLQAGMIIGEARGKHAKGRYGNIGHIVQIIERDGKKYVTESTSAKGKDGKTGVRETLLSEYVSNLNRRKFNVFVADPYRELRGQMTKHQAVGNQPVSPLLRSDPNLPLSQTATQTISYTAAIPKDWQRKLQAKETVSGAENILNKLSKQYRLPDNMLYSVWTQESIKGNLRKASSAGAKGHFQFMPRTAQEFGIAGKEWDFNASATAAAKKYSGLLKMYDGDVSKALAAYNYGEGNLNKLINRHGNQWLNFAPKETQVYVNNIHNMMAARAQKPIISARAPIGGSIVSENLTRQQEQIVAARQLAQNHAVTNNTEVMVQNVNIQTASDTMRGVGSDMVNGIRDKLSQFNMGMI